MGCEDEFPAEGVQPRLWPTRYGLPGGYGIGTGTARGMDTVRMLRFPIYLLAAAALSGCTLLPGTGPTASAIEAGAAVPEADGALLARYEIIDVTPAVIEALRGRPLDSLLASFGDHRPSAEPLIGIGDMVAVSIWEAGSGGLFSGPLVSDRFSAGSKSALIPSSRSAATGPSPSPMPGASPSPAAGRRTSRR